MNVRRGLELIFGAAVSAVEPSQLVRQRLVREGPWVAVCDDEHEWARWRGTCLVVGAGKAAARMAAGCEARLPHGTWRGCVVTADGCAVPLVAVEVLEAAHPFPDERGWQATRHIARLVKRDGKDPVLCLISGGASSLLVCPRPPITLRDKVATTRLLHSSGADIGELNTVRKHLAAVKGGGLALMAGNRPLITLVLSDVIGDDPAVVGSGPTAADPTTFEDAWAVLRRYGLEARVPRSVQQLLRRGMEGDVPETLKPGRAGAAGPVNVVIGSNRTALQAAAAEARRLGYEPVVAREAIRGDTAKAAELWGDALMSELLRRPAARLCFLAGGETTVEVRGPGRGGRNQEFALALARRLANSGVTLLSAGTDGIDGPTDAAGAFVDGTTIGRAHARNLDAESALLENDSYTFFAQLGDLFRPGPTGTNVMDIKIATSSTR